MTAMGAHCSYFSSCYSYSYCSGCPLQLLLQVLVLLLHVILLLLQVLLLLLLLLARAPAAFDCRSCCLRSYSYSYSATAASQLTTAAATAEAAGDWPPPHVGGLVGSSLTTLLRLPSSGRPILHDGFSGLQEQLLYVLRCHGCYPPTPKGEKVRRVGG